MYLSYHIIILFTYTQHGRYDPTVSVVENIDLPPSLMSRFDLIYLVLDKPDPISDRRLAKHLISMYGEHGANAHTVTTHTLVYRVRWCRIAGSRYGLPGLQRAE